MKSTRLVAEGEVTCGVGLDRYSRRQALASVLIKEMSNGGCNGGSWMEPPFPLGIEAER